MLQVGPQELLINSLEKILLWANVCVAFGSEFLITMDGGFNP